MQYKNKPFKGTMSPRAKARRSKSPRARAMSFRKPGQSKLMTPGRLKKLKASKSPRGRAMASKSPRGRAMAKMSPSQVRSLRARSPRARGRK